PDYIDPAILRPERIDRKVKVIRPGKTQAKEILGIHLHDRLPISPDLVKEFDGEVSCARKELIEFTIGHLWKQSKETEFLKVQRKSGATDTLHWSDMVSGALLKSIVDRAKEFGIRRAIQDSKG